MESVGELLRREREAQEKRLASLPPAGQDLDRLRQECDGQKTVVTLVGVTRDSAALHRYLAELGRVDLFDKVDLRSMETDSSDRVARIQFTAMVIVRPGYGQPGGPTEPLRAVGTSPDHRRTESSSETKSPAA